MATEHVRIRYTNYRGETSERFIIPFHVEFTASPWHPEEQWILTAWDIGKNEERGFAMKDILAWEPMLFQEDQP